MSAPQGTRRARVRAAGRSTHSSTALFGTVVGTQVACHGSSDSSMYPIDTAPTRDCDKRRPAAGDQAAAMPTEAARTRPRIEKEVGAEKKGCGRQLRHNLAGRFNDVLLLLLFFFFRSTSHMLRCSRRGGACGRTGGLVGAAEDAQVEPPSWAVPQSSSNQCLWTSPRGVVSSQFFEANSCPGLRF